MRHAIIDKNGRVVNVIIWEGAEFLPPRGHIVMRTDDAQLDDHYDLENKLFITPEKKKRVTVNGKCSQEELSNEIFKSLEEKKFGPFDPSFSSDRYTL